MVLEKTLESPLNCKEVQPVYPKGDQSWVFIGRTDAEAPMLWPPDCAKTQLSGKTLVAGKDWGEEEKGTTEDEMVGWHHRLNDVHPGFGWTPGVGDGQGGLACCCSRGCKELDMTEWLNWFNFRKQMVTFPKNSSRLLCQIQWSGYTIFYCLLSKYLATKKDGTFLFIKRPHSHNQLCLKWGRNISKEKKRDL